MRFPEFIYNFFGNQSEENAPTEYHAFEDKPSSSGLEIIQLKNNLKIQVKALITKHKNYLKSYKQDSIEHTRSQNKLKLLKYCEQFLEKPRASPRQGFNTEKLRQDRLPTQESYQYNDGWLQVFNPRSIWQTPKSETATVVEEMARIMNNTPEYDLADEQSSRLFVGSYEDLDHNPMSPLL